MVQRTRPDVGMMPNKVRSESWFNSVGRRIRGTVMPDGAQYGSARRAVGRRATERVWASRLGRLIPRLALVVAVGLLISAIALFTFRATYADKVYPAVAVGDVAVGGLTVEEAVATVERRAGELERGSITFSYNGQTWSPTLSELGAKIDIEASVDAAYELGRDESAVERLGFTNQLLRSNQQVPLRTTVDRNVLAAWFDSVNADIGQRAVDARLEVQGASVRVVPEQTGVVVDEAVATEHVLAMLRGLEPVNAELPTLVETPNIYAADLEEPRADLEAALDGPVMAMFENQKWDIPAADLAQFLSVETVYRDGAAKVELAFAHESLSSYLREDFAGRVNRSPVNAQVTWNFEQGHVMATEPSIDGAALRANAFAEAVEESFLSDQRPVEIPVVVTKPEIDSNNLAALKIDSRLARGTSNFDNGPADRDENIEVGTELLNGELIAPGEEFSFNGAVGEITHEKGFVDAGVIEAETIGRDVGGGICQVSTTVFRAALLAGMPITEWWPHSLRLQGYERDGWTAGYDASILQSGSNPEYWADFRFKNDTDGYMLVHAWSEYPLNIVEIYGHDDGRDVDLSDPEFSVPDWKDYEDKEVVDPDLPDGTIQQTQWPTEPYAAWFTRTITYPDGEVAERTFESVYEGSGNVYRVSSDMEGRSPAADNASRN